ncbi:MAG: sialate O-acetylesterase [Melioribacteraceae bacterium]|nr:sialate O-acetylesterase [Melioribacteraceae bacterium]
MSINLFAKKYRLIFLGGQSNMTGFGLTNQLPSEYLTICNYVKVFCGTPKNDCDNSLSLGIWDNLKPGFGDGFYFNGKNFYSEKFGPELSFGKEIKKFFNDGIAIIKYTKNGASIHSNAAGQFGCWEPDFEKCNKINQFDHFLNVVYSALSFDDIDCDAVKDTLIPTGIIWMQGESDATISEEIAFSYKENLTNLINKIREAFNNKDIPVVIGKISDSFKGNNEENRIWKFGKIIMQQQEDYVAQNKNVSIVRTTSNYGYSDKYHYDTNGYIDLGKQFANELIKLIKNEK